MFYFTCDRSFKPSNLRISLVLFAAGRGAGVIARFVRGVVAASSVARRATGVVTGPGSQLGSDAGVVQVRTLDVREGEP